MSTVNHHNYRHESCVAQIIFVDFDGNPTGEKGDEETFIDIDGLWYPIRTIKAGAIGYRPEQLVVVWRDSEELGKG